MTTVKTARRGGKAWARAGLITLALAFNAAIDHAWAQDAGLEADARAAIATVFDALASGDAGQVRPLLAPEFQLVRSNGAAYDKEEYLARSIPHIDSEPAINNLVVTRNGDIVVTRFRLRIEEGALEEGERVAVIGHAIDEPDPDAVLELGGYRSQAAERRCLVHADRAPLLISDNPACLDDQAHA